LEKTVPVFWAQALKTYQQHIWQSFKNMLLSKNLDQNMQKNALFFGKNCKNRRNVGDSAPKPPLASGGWGLRPQNLKIAIMFCFHFSFLTSNSAQGTLANTTGSDFLAS